MHHDQHIRYLLKNIILMFHFFSFTDIRQTEDPVKCIQQKIGYAVSILQFNVISTACYYSCYYINTLVRNYRTQNISSLSCKNDIHAWDNQPLHLIDLTSSCIQLGKIKAPKYPQNEHCPTLSMTIRLQVSWLIQ